MYTDGRYYLVILMCFHPDLGISLLFHHFFHGAHFHRLLVKSSFKTLWPSKLSWVFRLLAVAPGPHEDFNIQPSIHKLTFVQILFSVSPCLISPSTEHISCSIVLSTYTYQFLVIDDRRVACSQLV